MMRWLMGVLAALLFAASAGAADLNAAQAARYHRLTTELRCVICQNRSIASSDAPLAHDLRRLVAKQIEAGRSDTQIKQYLVARYGQWVLYDPPWEFATWLLWLGPFLLLVAGLAGAVVIMCRRENLRPPALDRDRLARVLGENMPRDDRRDDGRGKDSR